MSDARSQQEPTMEEILSSIRRIISEDGEPEGEEKDNAEEAVEATSESTPAPELSAPPDLEDDDIFDLDAIEDEVAAEVPAAPAPGGDDEEVLELTEVVDGEDDTVVNLHDEVEEMAQESVPVPDALAAPEPEPEQEPEPDAFAEPEPEPSVELEPKPELEPEPEFEPEPPPLRVSDVGPMTEPVEELVSGEAVAAAAAALTGLHHTVAATRGVPLGNPGRTLDDIVKELLRPMLKQWLDQNLSLVVERIVAREIAKLVGKAEDKR